MKNPEKSQNTQLAQSNQQKEKSDTYTILSQYLALSYSNRMTFYRLATRSRSGDVNNLGLQTTFPKDIWLIIISYLFNDTSFSSLLNLRVTCKFLQQLVMTEVHKQIKDISEETLNQLSIIPNNHVAWFNDTYKGYFTKITDKNIPHKDAIKNYKKDAAEILNFDAMKIFAILKGAFIIQDYQLIKKICLAISNDRTTNNIWDDIFKAISDKHLYMVPFLIKNQDLIYCYGNPTNNEFTKLGYQYNSLAYYIYRTGKAKLILLFNQLYPEWVVYSCTIHMNHHFNLCFADIFQDLMCMKYMENSDDIKKSLSTSDYGEGGVLYSAVKKFLLPLIKIFPESLNYYYCDKSPITFLLHPPVHIVSDFKYYISQTIKFLIEAVDLKNFGITVYTSNRETNKKVTYKNLLFYLLSYHCGSFSKDTLKLWISELLKHCPEMQNVVNENNLFPQDIAKQNKNHAEIISLLEYTNSFPFEERCSRVITKIKNGFIMDRDELIKHELPELNYSSSDGMIYSNFLCPLFDEYFKNPKSFNENAHKFLEELWFKIIDKIKTEEKNIFESPLWCLLEKHAKETNFFIVLSLYKKTLEQYKLDVPKSKESNRIIENLNLVYKNVKELHEVARNDFKIEKNPKDSSSAIKFANLNLYKKELKNIQQELEESKKNQIINQNEKENSSLEESMDFKFQI